MQERSELETSGEIVVFGLAGAGCASLSVAVDGGRPAAVVLWALVLALVARALAALVRATLGLRSALASTIGCWVVLAFTLADAAYFGLFDEHIGRHAVLLGWDALRTRVVRLGALDVLAGLAGAAVLFVLIHLVARAARRLPPLKAAWDRGVRRAVIALATALVILVVFRDLVLPSNAAWTRPFFWHHPLVQQERRDEADAKKQEVHFGRALDEIAARALVAVTEDLRAKRFQVSAARRDDVLFVHVESLRADKLTATSMPGLFAWSKRCATSARHYATSNSTGGGAFGAMTGLAATYFDTSRRDRVLPVPLRVLAELGYERRVWFPNEALGYDGLLGALFGDLALPQVADREPVYEADALTLETFLAQQGARTAASAPRFDYLVLDSTHYDYSYPDAFAKHLPVATLGGTLNRRTGEGTPFRRDDAREALGEGVHNRYRNSVLYVDSLVDRLLRTLEERGALDRTIVVIFGDHGESFWDNGGGFGHATALTDAQTRVPLVICSKPEIDLRYAITSHADIFPTVFDLLGVRAARPFMTGKSLARFAPALDHAILRSAVSSVATDPRHAIVIGDVKVAYSDDVELRALWGRDAKDEKAELSPDLVTTALAAAVSAKLLREPRGL